jgi:exodeoxyribonuclease-3
MLRVMTYNIATGGVDDDLTNRLPLIHAVVRAARPDVLAVQEANELDLRWLRRLFAFERATGLRGFLGLSRSGFHGALFVRPGLEPIFLRTDDAAGNRSLMEMSLEAASGFTLTVSAVHLDPISPEMRLAGILQCTNAPPAIVMGDFNNCRGDDLDAAQVWARFSPRHQARAGTTQVDDRVFTALERAGYVDLYRRFHPGEHGYTTRAAGGLRLDYIFATEDLAARATACDVIRTPETDRASDHYPVVADFDLDVESPKQPPPTTE